MIGRSQLDQITSARVVRSLVLAALSSHTADAIIETGMRVETLVEKFRRIHPDQVPTEELSGGLLNMGVTVVPVNDWELARHLECTVEAMRALRAQFDDVSPLLAYVAVMALRAEPPDWLHDALPVIVLESNAAQEIRAQELREAIERLRPLADHGQRFTAKKPGSLGPVAKRVKAHMQKNPRAKADQVWSALKKTPPKDHEFMESERFGRYIECGAKTVMEWPRFRNLVSEHRPKE